MHKIRLRMSPNKTKKCISSLIESKENKIEQDEREVNWSPSPVEFIKITMSQMNSRVADDKFMTKFMSQA